MSPAGYAGQVGVWAWVLFFPVRYGLRVLMEAAVTWDRLAREDED